MDKVPQLAADVVDRTFRGLSCGVFEKPSSTLSDRGESAPQRENDQQYRGNSGDALKSECTAQADHFLIQPVTTSRHGQGGRKGDQAQQQDEQSTLPSFTCRQHPRRQGSKDPLQ